MPRHSRQCGFVLLTHLRDEAVLAARNHKIPKVGRQSHPERWRAFSGIIQPLVSFIHDTPTRHATRPCCIKHATNAAAAVSLLALRPALAAGALRRTIRATARSSCEGAVFSSAHAQCSGLRSTRSRCFEFQDFSEILQSCVPAGHSGSFKLFFFFF
jgi:hypothetical protein